MNYELIRRTRAVYGLNQHEFAEVLGISRSVIAKVETGVYPVTDKLASAMRREFGAQLDVIARLGGLHVTTNAKEDE